MLIHNVEVKGTGVDFQTRCAHYKSDIDIIAIKFKCCGDWFPCFACHAEHADHPAEIWPQSEAGTKAILCGGCGGQLSIDEYVDCASVCPQCRRSFNPGCANHYHLYFEAPAAKKA